MQDKDLISITLCLFKFIIDLFMLNKYQFHLTALASCHSFGSEPRHCLSELLNNFLPFCGLIDSIKSMAEALMSFG